MTIADPADRGSASREPVPSADARPSHSEVRQRAEPETHHIHEVRLTRPPEPKGSSGMPTAVAGGLALVVGLAGGFGYSTYKALRTPEPEPVLSQFEPVGPPSATAADDLAEEFRDESVAALFQVPASPSPNPFTPSPTPAAVQADPAPAASNPFEASPPEPTATPAANVAAPPAIAPKGSNWTNRDKKSLAPRNASPTLARPAAPSQDAAVDPALFVAAPKQPASVPAPPADQVEPLFLPESEPTPARTPEPFQRPITDGSLRGPVMPVQFEQSSPAAPKPFTPAQGGFGVADEAPAAPGAPGTVPSAPPAAQSTVPSFGLGGSEPAPVSPPAFPSNGLEPARRAPRAAPFTPAQDFADSSDLNARAPTPAPAVSPQVPTPAPAPFSAGNGGGRSIPVPAARANFGSVDPTNQPPNWSGREEATATDPFRQQAGVAAANGQFTGEETVHTVESGENYWTISRKHYGMGRYFTALAEFNKSRIPDPKMLKPGMKVVVPTAAALTEKYAHLISGAAPAKTYAPQTADASGEPAIQQVGFHVDRSGQPLYRVAEGDTLSDIAETCLGRSSRWVQIYGLNRDQLKSPNDLKLGMLLRLPQDASGVQAAPEASVIR